MTQPPSRQLVDRGDLRGRLAYLFQTGEGADCEIYVEDALFRVHRCILLTASAPMRMQLLETAQHVRPPPQLPHALRLYDVTPDAVGALLTYLYSGVISVSDSTAVDTYIAADKFDIGGLRRRAEFHLPRSLSVGTVAGHLVKACRLKQMQLAGYLSAYIARHMDAFLESAGFLALPRSIIRALLCSPNICVESETKVRARPETRAAGVVSGQ